MKKVKLQKGSKPGLTAMLNREIEEFKCAFEAIASHLGNGRDIAMKSGELEARFFKEVARLKGAVFLGELRLRGIVEEAKKKGG